MAEPERSFAGYTYQQRLSVGFFGEVYRAVGSDNRVARVLHVDPHLAGLTGFSESLARHGGQLGLLEHKNAESTILVGTTPDGVHVVVTEGAAGPVLLSQILGDAHAAAHDVPAAVALAIGRAVVSALAHAHRVGICHGGVHPRSVHVDIHGGVKLADFAPARALAAAAAAADAPQLLKAKGYVAPELALGDDPSPASDVYAAGVLLFELLTGALPPGDLAVAPEVAVVIAKALSTDPGARYPSAIELRAALKLALERAGVEAASVKEIASFVNDLRTAAEANLDAETEDVLASLAAPAGGGRAATVKSSRDDPSLDEALEELVADLPVRGETPPPEPIGIEEEEDAPTEVDHRPTHGDDDPVSALIRANPSSGVKPFVRLGSESEPDDEDTYIPPAMTDSDVELAEAAARARRLAGRRSVSSEPRHQFRPPSGTDPVAPVMPVRSSSSGIWILTTVVALAGLFIVLYTQTDLFHPGRRAEKERRRQAEIEAKRKAAEENRVRAGDVRIDANEPDAAVWLLLGRTPADTISLSAAAVHQIRVEHEGYQPADIDVLAAQWTGSGDSMRARVVAELTPAAPGTEAPAAPPAPKRPITGREGRGTVHIESTPPGANAYLLVGFTPEVELRGVRAGVDYEFKVVKKGFAPGYVVIRAEDWKNDAGRFVKSVEGTAELAPLPGPKK